MNVSSQSNRNSLRVSQTSALGDPSKFSGQPGMTAVREMRKKFSTPSLRVPPSIPAPMQLYVQLFARISTASNIFVVPEDVRSQVLARRH